MKRVALLVVAIVAGCSAGISTGHETPRVTLQEFAIDAAGDWEAGESVVSVLNDGEFAHTLVVTRSDGTVMAATDLISPGEESSFEIALEPGTYQLTCRIVAQTPDGDLVDHYEEGMVTTVAVGS